MWEFLTGVQYSSEKSDLDLVVDVADVSLIDPAVAFLSQVQAMAPWKLDAEISIPEHGEVHWKEWLAAADTVLVKSLKTVELRPREWMRLDSVL